MKTTPTLKNVGLFATPTSMQYFQEYLDNFNGNEATVANVAAWMAYNLAGEQTKAPEGSVDIRMTIEEMKTITECVSISIINACNEHKKKLVDLHYQLASTLDDIDKDNETTKED